MVYGVIGSLDLYETNPVKPHKNHQQRHSKPCVYTGVYIPSNREQETLENSSNCENPN